MFENDDNLNHKSDSDSGYDSFFNSSPVEEPKPNISTVVEQVDENLV